MIRLRGRCFSNRQIKEIEKAKSKLIRKIDLFVDGIEFVNEHYIVVETIGTKKESDWIEELKYAINNIDLQNNKILGETIRKQDNIYKTILIVEYLQTISNKAIRPMEWKVNPIEKTLKSYNDQVKKILKIELPKHYSF